MRGERWGAVNSGLRVGLVGAAMLLLAGCNFGVPQVTPTVAPSRTFTETQPPSATFAQTATASASATATATATETATATATETTTGTATTTETATTTQTPTETATATETPLPTLTETPRPALPTPLPTIASTRTVRPTNTLTPTATPTDTATATSTPTETLTPLPTDTPPPTETAPPSATLTPLPTDTLAPTDTLLPTDTPPPSATLTPPPSATFTPLPTDTLPPTETPLPSSTLTPLPTDTLLPTETPLPSATFTPLPTDTLPPTETPRATPSPFPTATATLNVLEQTDIARTQGVLQATQNALDNFSRLTQTAQANIVNGQSTLSAEATRQVLLLTQASILNQLSTRAAATSTSIAQTQVASAATQLALIPTAVPPPTGLPTAVPVDNIFLPIPTLAGPLDVTPTFEIVQANTPPVATALLPGTAAPIGVRPEDVTPAQFPTFSATDITLAVIAPTGLPGPDINFGLRGFALTTAGGFSINPIDTAGAARFSIDPVTGTVARSDISGLLYIGDYRLDSSPFSQFTPPSVEENNAPVAQVAYAPVGASERWLAFIVDTEADASAQNDGANDGVWVYSANRGGSVQLFYDCPPEPGCALVQHGEGPYAFRTRDLAWNYSGTALVIEVDLAEEGRGAFKVVQPDAPNPGTLAPICRYDYASWGNARGNTDTVIGSGRGLNLGVGIYRIPATTAANCQPSETLFDASAAGLWVQNAVERTDGSLYSLGSGSGQNTPLGLYAIQGGQAVPLTGPIGAAAPSRVDWSPNRDAVLLVVPNGDGSERYFVATIAGDAREITANVAGALAVEWAQ